MVRHVRTRFIDFQCTSTLLKLHAAVVLDDRGGVGVGHAVAGVAAAEEGLVVVGGELGKAGDELFHRLSLARPPSTNPNQPGLLQVVRQPRSRLVLHLPNNVLTLKTATLFVSLSRPASRIFQYQGLINMHILMAFTYLPVVQQYPICTESSLR